MTNTTESLKKAVEDIARLEEKLFLKESPFHLQSCGGCGAPSFQQPCIVCNYYPRGSDKGTWHPNEATIDHFRRSVEKSGPDGKNGTLATWYIGYLSTIGRRQAPDQRIVCQAAELEVPSVEDVWNTVTESTTTILRDRGDHAAHWGWSGFFELKNITGGGYHERYENPHVHLRAVATMKEWTVAVHENDEDGMLDCLSKAIELTKEAIHKGDLVGNLRSAISNFERSIERIEARKTKLSY